MQTKFGILLALGLGALPAFAEEHPLEQLVLEATEQGEEGQAGEGQRRLPAACRESKITDAQKQSIGAAMKKHAREGIAREAAMKTARLDLLETVTNPSSTLEQASAASAKATEAFVAILDAKSALKLEILYNVLTPEQRAPAIKCFHQLKSRRHEGRGPHGRPGRGGRHGGGHDHSHGRRGR